MTRRRGQDVSLGELEMRRGIVEPAMQQILCRVDQREFGVVGGESARECLKERLDGACMAVERQTERMISEQAGRVRPVASGLRVANRFDWLGVGGGTIWPPTRHTAVSRG